MTDTTDQTSLTPPSRRWSVNKSTVMLALVLLVAGTALLATTQLWRKLNVIQTELAKRSADTGAQAVEARVLAKQAQERSIDLAARLTAAETRLSEVSLQRSQLDELLQSLSRSRDENMVVDLESALRLALQQAQLSGSVEPLVAALKSGEARLSRVAQPRLNSLQRAIARDLDRVKTATMTDVPSLLVKLDELVRLIDELQLSNAMALDSPVDVVIPNSAASPVPKSSASGAVSWWDRQAIAAWWQRSLQGVRNEMRGLLRVSRIDQPEAVLLSPEQSFFVRENLKLKLLNVRLALLSRQFEIANADLASISAALTRYFDMESRKTQVAKQLLVQIQSQMKPSELPRLDETLAAIATAATGR